MGEPDILEARGAGPAPFFKKEFSRFPTTTYQRSDRMRKNAMKIMNCLNPQE